MKRVAVVAAVVLAVAVGWVSVAWVHGQEAETKAPPAESARPAPAVPVKAAPPVKAEPARMLPAEPGSVVPPPPLPDVEIPPIPEVDKDPFKPGPVPARKKKPDVIDEGKHLFNREGRIDVDPIGRSFFVFDSGEKPMRILENSWREFIESVTDHGKKQAKWRISGTVMVYEGANYVLVTRAVRIIPEEENL